jgi:HAD superfamily hydrolase (TIGR01490 family)
MTKDKKKVAIFDIDGTVFRTGVMFEVVDRMIEEGMLPKEASATMIEAKDAWKNRQGKFELFDEHFIDLVEHGFQGIDVSEFETLAAEVIGEVKDHQYRYTRALMERFRDQGYALVAISGGLQKVLDIYNRYLGFDTVYAAELIEKDGKFTGEKGDSPYYDKSVTVERYLKDNPTATLDDSYGVGDTASDVAFLKLVAHPIAFNPNRELFDVAMKNDWEIVVERKDVIYHINEPATDTHLKVE